ncbi:MAG: ATP-binding cassette domain-containing protein [Elusimicrobia bacterium]|nr:ATP-binding cassette domain-containing protein [Elusimicrobiota bacterium]
MIKVENLSRSYGSVKALDSVSFTASVGQITAFLGPNGAGKTTAFKILSGYLAQDSGSVFIGGMDASLHPLQCRAMTGYLPENNPLYEDMEVCEFLVWGGAARGLCGQALASALDRVVQTCGLAPAAGKPIGALSKGFRQRVGIANALIHSPKILLLDEPSSGLDPNQAAELRGLIRNLSHETAVLLSTHILSEAQALCDKVVLINRGVIAVQGTPQELARAKAPVLIAVFEQEAPASVQEAIAGLEGVSAVERDREAEDIVLRIYCVQGADLRGEVFALAARSGWPLLELKRERDWLEAMFRELTA